MAFVYRSQHDPYVPSSTPGPGKNDESQVNIALSHKLNNKNCYQRPSINLPPAKYGKKM